MSIMKRSPGSGNLEPSSSPAAGGDWSKWWPNVVEFLSMPRWPDGSLRETGTLLLFSEGGSWKCCAHDRDTGEKAFLASRTPEELLSVLDKGLETGQMDWRPDKARGKK
jgi:hypothetical protein